MGKPCYTNQGQRPSLIKNASEYYASLDGDKDLFINNFKELTINDDRKLILAASTL